MNHFSFFEIKSLKESKFLKIWLIFTVLSIAGYLIRYPQLEAQFENIFRDLGANLKADLLVTKGYAPSIDFNYLYGLLSLAIGRVWFSIFGRSLQAFYAFVLVCYVFSSAALARVAVIANLRKSGIIFLAISVPSFSFYASQFTFNTSLEPIFILFAISEHLAGRRGNALVFLVFSFFIKSSMSLVYFLLLIGLYIVDLIKGETNISKIFSEIKPVLISLAAVLTFLTIVFGFPTIVSSTLSPISGKAHYEAMNYGIFGVGKRFLYFPQTRYYIGHPGVWIISTLTLSTFLYSILIFKRNSLNNQIVEVQCSIALLYIIFLFYFFPGYWGWAMYSYLLSVGMALMTSKDNEYRFDWLIVILTIILLFNYYPNVSTSFRLWSSFKSSPSLPFLVSNDRLDREFAKVLSYCKTKKTLIFSPAAGGVDVLFPECRSPDAWWLLKGLYNTREVERINNQISESEIVILPQSYYQNTFYVDFYVDTYEGKLSEFESFDRGKYFDFLRRK
jgi:hypothetical protein